MSEPIRPGDLVMVVNAKKCGCGNFGRVFTAGYVGPSHTGSMRCVECGSTTEVYGMVSPVGTDPKISGYDIARLKRIPPMGESGDVKRDEEITA